MDNDGGFGIRNWGYYEQQSKGNLGLRLMSSLELNAKPLLPNGGFIRRHCSFTEPSVSMDFVRDGWFHHGNDNARNFHTMPVSHQQHSSYGIFPDPPAEQSIQTLQHPEPQAKEDKVLMVEETSLKSESPQKKKPRARLPKSPKPKKPKKVKASSDEAPSGSVSRGRAGRKSVGMVINGIDFDISRIPTPVCSCTGKAHPCYRWGIGGWQSACCTTNISMHPLPMSTTKRGVRIAGRKMSQGAFKKVLEKLAGEGYNLSNPIDLRTFWAKHGTNKYVTIR